MAKRYPAMTIETYASNGKLFAFANQMTRNLVRASTLSLLVYIIKCFFSPHVGADVVVFRLCGTGEVH